MSGVPSGPCGYTPLQLVNQLEARVRDCFRALDSIHTRYYDLRLREQHTIAQIRATITAYNVVVDQVSDELHEASKSPSGETLKYLKCFMAQCLQREVELKAVLGGIQPTINALLQDSIKLQSDIKTKLVEVQAIMPSALRTLIYSAAGGGVVMLALKAAESQGWMTSSPSGVFFFVLFFATTAIIGLMVFAVRWMVMNTLKDTLTDFGKLQRAVDFSMDSINHAVAAVTDAVTSEFTIRRCLSGFECTKGKLRYETARKLLAETRLQDFIPRRERLEPLDATRATTS